MAPPTQKSARVLACGPAAKPLPSDGVNVPALSHRGRGDSGYLRVFHVIASLLLIAVVAFQRSSSQVLQSIGILTTLPAASSNFYMHSLITTWWPVDV